MKVTKYFKAIKGDAFSGREGEFAVMFGEEYGEDITISRRYSYGELQPVKVQWRSSSSRPASAAEVLEFSATLSKVAEAAKLIDGGMEVEAALEQVELT